MHATQNESHEPPAQVPVSGSQATPFMALHQLPQVEQAGLVSRMRKLVHTPYSSGRTRTHTSSDVPAYTVQLTTASPPSTLPVAISSSHSGPWNTVSSS